MGELTSLFHFCRLGYWAPFLTKNREKKNISSYSWFHFVLEIILLSKFMEALMVIGEGSGSENERILNVVTAELREVSLNFLSESSKGLVHYMRHPT